MDIRQLSRHVLVPGSLDDSCLQRCKTAEWLKPACFIHTVYLNRGCHLCQPPSKTENLNYRNCCMNCLNFWLIALLCILPSDIIGCRHLNAVFQINNNKALNNLLSCFYDVAFPTWQIWRQEFVCAPPQSNCDWCVSPAHSWPSVMRQENAMILCKLFLSLPICLSFYKSSVPSTNFFSSWKTCCRFNCSVAWISVMCSECPEQIK